MTVFPFEFRHILIRKLQLFCQLRDYVLQIRYSFVYISVAVGAGKDSFIDMPALIVVAESVFILALNAFAILFFCFVLSDPFQCLFRVEHFIYFIVVHIRRNI